MTTLRAGVVNNPFGLDNVGFYANPSFADLDRDGDLDAFIGDNLGNTKYFENTGSLVSPAFSALSNNPFGLADVGIKAAPSFADLDGDGDLDIFEVNEQSARVWANDGSGVFSSTSSSFDLSFTATATF